MPTNLPSLTNEDLIQIIINQDKRMTKIELESKRLKEENIELKRQIKLLQKNSSNSSKPPSSDMGNGNGVKKNQSLRKRSGKKSGGQKGGKGTKHKFSENPDNIIECKPESCNNCFASLENKEGEVVEIRQENDVPPIKPIINEFRKIKIECDCGCINQGEFPGHIKAPFQIGANARSFIVYLNIAHLIPYKRLTQIVDDLFGFPISQGSIGNIIGYASEKGKSLHKTILNIIKGESYVGADETGMRVEGKRWWLWVWQNLKGSYYAISKSRGYKVVEENFGEDYLGKLIHDCWAAHNNTPAKGGHQHCHPHYQRDLEFIETGYKSAWAYKAHQFLLNSQKARDHIWKDDFDIKLRDRIILEYEAKLDDIINCKVTQKDEIRMQKRFKKHKDKVLLFMHDKDTPFHNNDSEKAIRNAKVKQKVSGGFRSEKGAEQYSILLSIIETSKKQNLNILESIRKLLAGDLTFQ